MRELIMSRTFELGKEVSLEVKQYKRVEKWCRQQVSEGAAFLFDPVLFQDTLYNISKEFVFPFETSHVVKGKMSRIAEEYTSGTSILSLSRASNYPPYLFCRLLVEQITVNNAGRKGLTDAMRDPLTLLGDSKVILPEYISSEDIARSDGLPRIDPRSSKPITRLAQEVMEAIDSDPMYGPRHDRDRSDIGVEYEELLEKCLKAIDVPFESEQALRDKGSSRTPDCLLSCPMGVRVKKKDEKDDGWRVICWIDSKALFGDVNTHQTSVVSQAESYVHRFGPGLILYWFGHAPLELLDDAHGDIVISGWKLPEPMLFPTGEFTTKQDTDNDESEGGSAN